MKYSFLKQMLSSGMTGFASSKRGAMVWAILLFTAVIVVNLATGGRVKLDGTLQSQLFEFLIVTILAVFGEPAIKLFSLFKKQPPEAVNDKT